MRSACVPLAGAFLAATLICLSSGCGGSGNLEAPPEADTKAPPSMDKMPGFNEMQDKLKKDGKIK